MDTVALESLEKAKVLSHAAAEQGIRYFMISFVDLLGQHACQAGSCRGDRRDAARRRRLCRFRRWSRHAARRIPTCSRCPIRRA